MPLYDDPTIPYDSAGFYDIGGSGRVLRLVLGDLVLDLNDPAETGLIVSAIDLGSPTIREVTQDLPNQDGDFDETAYFGTRNVSINGAAYAYGAVGSRQKALDSLAPFIAPKARPVLLYAFDNDVPVRSLNLRVGQWTSPISAGQSSAIQYQWKCPDPIAYGVVENEVDIPPSAGATTGRVYDLTFDRSYPTSIGSSGSAPVITGGNYPTWPLLRLFGPCVDPAIYWLDPITSGFLGVQIVFTGITVDAGTYLEIDTKDKTVLLNGDPAANRYSFVDFANTVWGPLQPGGNRLKFAASSSASPSILEIIFQDAFIS